MTTKIVKKISFILLIVVIGGLGGILADRYFFPYLSTTKLFSKYAFLKKSMEDITVINKTEQVLVKEDSSISKISDQVSSSIVNIVSLPNPEKKSLAKNTSTATVKNGTGLIATSDGLIMTYAAAINPDNAKYKVLTGDGNSYDADLQGIDSYSNLAFLKINASNLPAVSFGNSDDATPGEKVVAIGNNLANYGNLFETGLLQGFDPNCNLAGKTVSSSEKLEGVFKTDFDPGNNFTGGPIIDYSGQVIGITGSLPKDNGVQYFQIPSNKMKNVIDRAIKKELDQDPILGIYYLPLSKTLAISNNLSRESGALIFSSSGQQGLVVIAGTPAQKAGLQLNDIITKINDQEINSSNSLSDLLYQQKKGDQITLTVLRNGQEIKIPVQL